MISETFATEGVYYDVVPGMAHFDGLGGIGVSGGLPSQDMDVARAGLAAIAS